MTQPLNAYVIPDAAWRHLFDPTLPSVEPYDLSDLQEDHGTTFGGRIFADLIRDVGGT